VQSLVLKSIEGIVARAGDERLPCNAGLVAHDCSLKIESESLKLSEIGLETDGNA
jgi:hypothetical protein